MKQGSVLYLSLVVVGWGLGLTSACSDDEDPQECIGSDCGGASNGGGSGIAGAKATGGSKATGGAASTAKGGATSGGATGVGGAVTTVGGSTAVGGATGNGGTTAATGGTTAVGGSTAAGGATTAAGGATTAVGGRTAAGGTTTAVAGSTSLGGTTGVAGNAGTPNNNAGTAGIAGAPALGPNLALGATWWGDGAPTATGTYPRVFASSQKPDANTPNKLFDGINSGVTSIWVSKTVPTTAAPELLGVEFASPVTISAVVLEGRINGAIAYNPSDYTIETSDTGVDGSWIERGAATRAQTWAITASHPDNITTWLTTPTTAKWIRLKITDTWYTNGTKIPDSTQLAELRIH